MSHGPFAVEWGEPPVIGHLRFRTAAEAAQCARNSIGNVTPWRVINLAERARP